MAGSAGFSGRKLTVRELTHFRARLYARLRSHCPQAPNLEDAVQEAFARLCSHDLSELDDDRLMAWLIVVAHRWLIDDSRRCSHLEALQSGPSLSLNPEHVAILHAIVEMAMSKLTTAAKDILIHRANGASVEDISAATGLSPENCMKRLQRAREAFKEALLAAGIEGEYLAGRTLPRTGRRQPGGVAQHGP